MRVIIQKNYDNMSRWAANYVARRINDAKPNAEKIGRASCRERVCLYV